MSSELDKLLRDIKFLADVKDQALDQRNVPVPYGRPDLYQTQMFTIGVVNTLVSKGYKIEKKDKRS